MYFIIGGDLAPTPVNYSQFADASVVDTLREDTVEILQGAAFRIFNLETVLYDGNSPIKKIGPRLSAPCKTIVGIKAIGADLLSMANNHIMDHGSSGLISTMACLKKAGIASVGAGQKLSEACRPYFFEFADKKIGVYSCAEHEFSIAGENSPGANPAELTEIFDHIQQTSKMCDFVVVLYHGGKEFYRYPSPNLRKVCRKLIDKGANLIIAQHSHCVGCKEEYNNGTIVYGQGNFLFERKMNEFTAEGLLVTVDDRLNVGYIPIRQCNMDNFYQRSEEIKKPFFVEEHYREFAKLMYPKQLKPFMKKESLLFRGLNKLFGNRLREIRAHRVSEKQIYARINYIDCEAHRELLLTGLKEEARCMNEDDLGK